MSEPRFAQSEPKLIYLDESIAVIDKPPGWATHASKGLPDRVTCLSWLRDLLGKYVYPAHRLDRATSGLLVFALNPEAASELGRQFSSGSVEKRYEAWVRGWAEEEGIIDRPLRSDHGQSVQSARSRYRTLARVEEPIPVSKFSTARFSLVEIWTETGRFHQIRRHFHSISHPLIGDTQHGDGAWNRHARTHWGMGRLFLDSAELEFELPFRPGCRLRIAHAEPEEWEQLRVRFTL